MKSLPNEDKARFDLNTTIESTPKTNIIENSLTPIFLKYFGK